MRKLSRAAALFLIAVYRTTLSPFTGCTCRFQPTCSAYARSAFETLSPGRALVISIRRFVRCHPLGPSGYDPVPERKSS